MFKFKLEGAASTLLSYWWAIRPAIKYTMALTQKLFVYSDAFICTVC